MADKTLPALNPDLLDTGTPPIPQAQGWARAYDGRSGPLVDLSQAVPGSPPPAALLERLAQAAASPDATRYGPITGDMVLREAYAADHEMTLRMLGIEARPLPCDPAAGFVPDVATAEALIDAGTRAIVLVTPNNPTGAIYPPATIAAFAELCAGRGLWLVLDETYRDFLPAGAAAPHEVFATTPWQDSVIGLYSFSKAYAVPGWRLGAITAGEAVMAEIAKVLDCVQINPVRAGQAAVTWGIDGIRDWREANRAEINARAALFREAMAPLNDWRVLAAGAYFAYVAHPFPDVPAAEVVRALVQERGVLALPGPYFGPGQERHLRIAIANVAADRIGALSERLRGFAL